MHQSACREVGSHIHTVCTCSSMPFLLPPPPPQSFLICGQISAKSVTQVHLYLRRFMETGKLTKGDKPNFYEEMWNVNSTPAEKPYRRELWWMCHEVQTLTLWKISFQLPIVQKHNNLSKLDPHALHYADTYSPSNFVWAHALELCPSLRCTSEVSASEPAKSKCKPKCSVIIFKETLPALQV